jgi:hypothetical protein
MSEKSVHEENSDRHRPDTARDWCDISFFRNSDRITITKKTSLLVNLFNTNPNINNKYSFLDHLRGDEMFFTNS